MNSVELRNVVDADIPIFFHHQREAGPEIPYAPEQLLDRYREKWTRIRADASNRAKTIVVDGEVAGHVGTFIRFGAREVTYWLGRSFWGKGIATRAVTAMLESEERPMFARVATTNAASLRVLEKCGFVVLREERYFAEELARHVDEVVLRRD